ncbi:F-box domain containing protein [Pyrenophora tritici-repentis]|uniref:YccV multi-domain protein n=2 Tax=Pyrenophora tritici-repentis TaxID=45151 RepID=A0A2W1E5N6_9PLEO|nr:YccV multi-domain protein [Pyrenophora tritici-repentis]KAF7444998.1 YccV multi-domain protein [Pyrenophora tritici-repentis]KAF7565260.1 YccV multi-domain protein [Pyrenophora tritici-repentis]KAG9380598.1 YccV multi-domain protein [Pyrenophora tritici-repentis]KAI0575982.1 YccV multi-domain protein [Pyrenophora tritici-repentis]
MMQRPSFTALPTEILEAIFLNLDPHSLVSVSQTNRLIKRLTADAPIVWRHLCKTRFKTWDSRHNIAAKFAGPLSDIDWRALYIRKHKIERRTRDLLNHVVATEQERIRYINDIADFGYDAKEVLLRECACPDDAEDVLARRYYANAVLERIHREAAIKVWSNLGAGKDVPIERALGAYDVFARVGEDVDVDVVADDISALANGLLEEYPLFRDWSPRVQASTLASYLRERGFNGVPDRSYRALKNSFIGLVLRSAAHESLPLISVAIYCAVARLVGLDARPCGFLFHVYTLVYAPKNYNLNGEYRPTSSTEREYMYLDPFRSTSEVRQGDLQRTLRDMGVPSSEHRSFLSDTTTREMVLRTARNIMNSVQMIRDTEAGMGRIQASWMNSYPDMDNAFYATIWAMLLLGPTDDTSHLGHTATRRRQYLPYLLEHFQVHYPWDVTLLARYVIPMFYNQPEGHRLLQFVQSMQQVDAMRKPAITRSTRTNKVTFKVGQLFTHKRYRYEGVITGWDVACDQSEDWIQNMRVDNLPDGRNQAFYHVLVCDKSVRYVAAENIQPVNENTGPSEALLKLAGRHFKRWDEASHCFVSNVRDEYPHD